MIRCAIAVSTEKIIVSWEEEIIDTEHVRTVSYSHINCHTKQEGSNYAECRTEKNYFC